MRSVIVIPARYGSSRLPGKPLLAETGKPLIQYTYEAAKASIADRVIVATDDQRIADAVRGFGGEVVMTSPLHTTGTLRVAEVAAGLSCDVIVNLQGDEPEINPKHLSTLIELHQSASKQGAFASTLVCPFPAEHKSGAGSPMDPACVKVVANAHKTNGYRRAIYFSRALIPYPHDTQGIVTCPTDFLLHVGLYAFTPESLQNYTRLPESTLERQENLEQLRILDAGHHMAVACISGAAPGIDTPADYDAFKARVQQGCFD